jgi:DNA-binding transcriptional ArsR family regulator
MAARPATRRSPERSTETPARAQVRDLSRGVASFAIDWDVRPVYDFVFSLSNDAGSTDDLPADDRAWLAAAKASLPADVRTTMTELFESELCVHSAVLAVDQRDVRTAADLVAAIETADVRAVIKAMFEDSPRDPELSELIERAIDGDTAVLDTLEERLPDWHKAQRLEILRNPDSTVAGIVAVLRAWAEVFTPIEARIAAILERDYEGRAADRATLAPADLIERTTGGIRWLPESGVRRVVLAPSYFARPYNFLMSAADWRFFGYPVSDDALEASDPLAAPQAVVRLHRALGDETRLKILKLLAGRDLYLTEIAQQLELSKPTIKHHLALLRSAGLVTITESGTVVYYTLRRNRLDDASADIKRFLIG